MEILCATHRKSMKMMHPSSWNTNMIVVQPFWTKCGKIQSNNVEKTWNPDHMGYHTSPGKWKLTLIFGFLSLKTKSNLINISSSLWNWTQWDWKWHTPYDTDNKCWSWNFNLFFQLLNWMTLELNLKFTLNFIATQLPTHH